MKKKFEKERFVEIMQNVTMWFKSTDVNAYKPEGLETIRGYIKNNVLTEDEISQDMLDSIADQNIYYWYDRHKENNPPTMWTVLAKMDEMISVMNKILEKID